MPTPPDDIAGRLGPIPTALGSAVALIWLSCGLHGSAVTSSADLSFERDVRPILKSHCFHCHGEGETLKGGVDLRLRRLMLTESDSGTVLTPGKPDESVLLKMVTAGTMPKGEKKLSPAEVETLRRWIASGAPTLRAEPEQVPKYYITEEERGFWSFQPVKRVDPPAVSRPGEPLEAIDSFLLQKLKLRGLGFAPEASRSSLIRRVTFDLTGLPPTPEEVDAFLADSSPVAYDRLIERLLASPRYGEAWARHWLDVAGYADSNGGAEADSERPWAWRYRDYVIRSLNTDKPWNRFITEQLAGDELIQGPYGELKGEALDCLIATGFLRLAPDPTGDGPPDADLAKNQVIADTLQIVSTSLLGLTVHCAQCHDHRYDPIPQSDYYRLRAILEPAFDWKHWKNPNDRLVSLMAAEDRHQAACIERAAQVIDTEANRVHDDLIEEFVQKQLELVPAELKEAVIGARRTPADKRSDEHRRLLREFPTFQDHIILGEVNAAGAKRVEEIRKRATELRALKPEDPRVHCLIEEPKSTPTTFLFHRGDHQQPREPIEPGGLTVLQRASTEMDHRDTNTVRKTTGRRLRFARELTDGSNPLVARVLVNRVWHHYFGAGIVGTLADFGSLGERPSHPELLDWLASELINHGWSLKQLHRTILRSAAYRQASIHPAAQAADPDNRLIGRQRLRRLPSESLRDALLFVSGRMNTNLYGAPTPVTVSPQGQFVVAAPPKEPGSEGTAAGSPEFRRSIYIQVRRSMPVGVMETFDTAALSPNCEVRAVSTIPAQSLMFLNDRFVLDRSLDLAERTRRELPGDMRQQVELLWRRLFAQAPSSSEVQKALVYLAEQTEILRAQALARFSTKADSKTVSSGGEDPSLAAFASLCQALAGSNRFLYLD
ncbi:MAG: PSD1 domain-containing protein [Verrucomicrobiales bacterium]|nr:PSD1 domain-containing protein [Verrucomicrobiales bacterium]